jgi:hypothetical protein
LKQVQDKEMTQRSTSADFVTAFATGWPENQPDIMVLSLTTKKGIQDFALNKEQAAVDRQNHERHGGTTGETEALKLAEARRPKFKATNATAKSTRLGTGFRP